MPGEEVGGSRAAGGHGHTGTPVILADGLRGEGGRLLVMHAGQADAAPAVDRVDQVSARSCRR